jgi:hypothetical protein
MSQRDLFATFLNDEFNVFKKTSRALAGDPKQKTHNSQLEYKKP